MSKGHKSKQAGTSKPRSPVIAARQVDVTVICATMPGRENVLPNAIRSVQEGILLPKAIRVVTSLPGFLPPCPQCDAGWKRNTGAATAETTWLAFIDDDNVWLPNYLYELWPLMNSGEYDVVYGFDKGITIRDPSGYGVGWNEQYMRVDITGMPLNETLKYLGAKGWGVVDSNACVRTDVFREVKGFAVDWNGTAFASTGLIAEDQDLWTRIALAGGRFGCAPVECWEYRGRGKFVRSRTKLGSEDTLGVEDLHHHGDSINDAAVEEMDALSNRGRDSTLAVSQDRTDDQQTQEV